MVGIVEVKFRENSCSLKVLKSRINDEKKIFVLYHNVTESTKIYTRVQSMILFPNKETNFNR